MANSGAARLPADIERSSAGRHWFSMAAFGLAAGLAVLLLSAAELALRTWWPQTLRVVQSASSMSQQSGSGQPIRANTRFVVEGPEYSVEYHTDHRGFRTAAEPTAAATSAKRLLLLGDSFTFGSGVAYHETWPVRLQQALRQDGLLFEVINAGRRGADTRSEVSLLERLLPQVQPNFVLLVFLPNDLFTNGPLEAGATLTSTTSRGMPSRVRTRRDKRSDFDVVTLGKRLLLSFDPSYVALYSISARREYFSAPPSDHCLRQLETTESLLATAASLCRQAGVPFAVVSLPQQFQVIAEASELAPDGVDVDHIDRSMREFAVRQGFRWISGQDALVEEYRKNGDDLYFRLDGHLNTAGHSLVARWLSDRFSIDLRYAL